MSGGVDVGVLDYGSGNLHSACRALDAAGARVHLSRDFHELRSCQRLVVPGVGAFAACMAQLRTVGGADFILDWVGQERPVLGICVGHQVFFAEGLEHEVRTAGLGIYDGVVDRLTSARLPHMGWNTVQVGHGSRLFEGVENERFYFVHSYAAHGGLPDSATITWCEHEGDRFVAAVEFGQVCSTQFHPEKSGAAGARLLRNWLDLLDED